jgi:hypothetical protein
MAEARLNSIFQVKDSFLPLHDAEDFLAKAEEFRKEPISIDDAIFRKTAYDAYYHKNEFNKSQTYHHKDYILHEIEEPIHRPEITTEYVHDHPQGTTTFFPSFLRGSYVDVEEKERAFESLLLRDIQPSPSEEEIIKARAKACMEEEQTIAFYQNEIQDRIASLSKKNPDFENTFKNYFKNLCIWMITGELKENMNERGLKDKYGIIEGPEYNFEAIPNLSQIHLQIQELNRTFDINKVLAFTNKEINTEKVKTIKKRKEDLEKKLEMEEIQKMLEELRKKAEEQARISRAKKDKQKNANKLTYKLRIKEIGETYTPKYLSLLKAEVIEVDGIRVNWDTLVGKRLDIENELKTNFLDTLATRMREILVLRKQLKEINNFLIEHQEEINFQINTAKDLGEELKYLMAFDTDEETHITNLLSFSKNFNDAMNLLIKKRKEITSYAFAMRWYESEKRESILSGVLSDIKLAMAGKYGDFYYSRGITKENEILVSYRVYDHGTFIKSVKAHPNQNINTEEIYFYRILDTEGKEKEVEFKVETTKRGTNKKYTLRFTLQDKTT